ncbi:MAG: hypothetical protein JXR90_17895 [Spirochaetes bacterium]|nr:hypothetical protein [Spirochaetota bacterium]
MRNTCSFLVVAVIMICGGMFAQQTALRKPAKYHMPAQYGDYSPVTEQERSEGDPWIVYGIYENTKTYNEPELQSEFKSLKFMQPYYVYEEKTELVRLCTDEDIDGVILNNPIDYGWVHKDKLLHSRRCVVTDPTGAINRKVMLINKREHLLRNDKEERADIIDFKSGPGNNYSSTGKESKLFNFFFAYEKTRIMDSATGKYTNWILLGNNERFSTWNYEDVIYGWVPEYRLIEWDQRVVLEPNWEEEAVRERKNGKKAIFFTESKDLDSYVNTGDLSNFLWMETGLDAEKYERPNGEWRRFALLPADPRYPDAVNAGISGEIFANGQAIFSDRQGADAVNKIKTEAIGSSNVNVVFVIDGTGSMGPYFGAVSSAISESINEIKKDLGGSVQLKFGVSVFRDSQEGPNYEYESQQLTLDSRFIQDWLKKTERIRNVNNRTYLEDLYPGIYRSLREMEFNENENNVMIVLGDAGTHEKDMSMKNEIINLLDRYNMNFLAFQLNADHLESSQKFEEHLWDLGNEYSKLIYSGDTEDNKSKNKAEDYRLEYDFDIEAHNILASTDRRYRVFPFESGRYVSISAITEEIKNVVTDIAKFSVALAQSVEAISSGQSIESVIENYKKFNIDSDNRFADCFGPRIYNLISESGANFDEIEFFKVNDKYQLYEPGLSFEKADGQRHNIYKKLLFISSEEWTALYGSIRKLLDTRSKEDLLNFMYEYAGIFYGEKSRSDYDQIKIENLLEKIYGIASENSLLKDYKIEEIKSLTNKQLRAILEDVEMKNQKLQSIMNDTNYEYSFKLGEVNFFWLSEDYLP